jgi:hypothetical protein
MGSKDRVVICLGGGVTLAEALIEDSESALLARIDSIAAQIEEAVANDPAGPGAVVWRAAVDELRAEVPALRARVMP